MKGNTFVKIGAQAFSEAKGTTVIPNTVVEIGQNAFFGATVLCEASEKPSGWHEDWCKEGTCTWGYIPLQ